MPPVPKSSSRKSGSPRSKACRAKSGCFTCRLRGKKCDGRRIGQDSGPCITCARLKLECLGFGVKRPAWLQDPLRASELKEKIKTHLAAQGLIKGRYGAGSRSPVFDHILELSDRHHAGDMGGRGDGVGVSGYVEITLCEGSAESDVPHPDSDVQVRHRQSPPPVSTLREYDLTDAIHLQPGAIPSGHCSLSVCPPHFSYGDTMDFYFHPSLGDSPVSENDDLAILQACLV